jgi:hypothetical protein
LISKGYLYLSSRKRLQAFGRAEAPAVGFNLRPAFALKLHDLAQRTAGKVDWTVTIFSSRNAARDFADILAANLFRLVEILIRLVQDLVQMKFGFRGEFRVPQGNLYIVWLSRDSVVV